MFPSQVLIIKMCTEKYEYLLSNRDLMKRSNAAVVFPLDVTKHEDRNQEEAP